MILFCNLITYVVGLQYQYITCELEVVLWLGQKGSKLSYELHLMFLKALSGNRQSELEVVFAVYPVSATRKLYNQPTVHHATPPPVGPEHPLKTVSA